jgi:hypothetical protein
MSTYNIQSPETSTARGSGRGFFLLGWFLVFLGIGIYLVQLLALKQYVVPWYAPALATVGFLAMLVGISRRRGILRFVGLVLCGLLAAAQWHFVLIATRAPAYAGPPAGQQAPAFAAIRADGTPFTDRDLASQPTALIFFRGHW